VVLKKRGSGEAPESNPHNLVEKLPRNGHVAPTHLGEHVTEVITSQTRGPLLQQNKCYKIMRYILG
jgi:hypothetical protein